MTVAVAPEVRLTMPARAEGVGVVRQALAGMADALAFNAAVVADMKMAVTEACTNVVVHAYDGDEGTLEVEMLADDTSLTIVVRDWGTGIQPRPHRREAPALGLGLPLIAALSDSFELRGSTNSGAEVRMTFIADRAADPAAANPGHRQRRRRRPLGPGSRTAELRSPSQDVARAGWNRPRGARTHPGITHNPTMGSSHRATPGIHDPAAPDRTAVPRRTPLRGLAQRLELAHAAEAAERA